MERAASFSAALRQERHRVVVASSQRSMRRALHVYDCVITLSRATDLVGHTLQRCGSAWIADISAEEAYVKTASRAAMDHFQRRLLLSADALTCPTDQARQTIFEDLAASATVVTDQDPSHITRQTRAVVSRRTRATAPSPSWRPFGHPYRSPSSPGGMLRVLMIGPVNSPHLEHLALAMSSRGHLVQAGGAVWGGGLPPSSLPDSGVPISVMSWPRTLWLRRLIHRFRPDVVHAHWLPFAALASLARARPLVAMAWGSDVSLADRRQRLANRLATRRANLVLADSSALLRELVRLGAQPERAALLNWGVDLDTFRPAAGPEERAALRKALGLGQGPVIISPRGLKSLYNPTVVLDAFSRVLTQYPDARLVLRHQGHQPPDLGALAGDNRISVVGRLPYDRVADYFRAADVCVSIPDSDSSPRSVWESMACGCACVLSDLPWAHELIGDGVHALIVPVDSGAVAEAVTRLLEGRELARSITTNAFELVRAHRNAQNETDRLEALYYRVAGEGASTPSAISSRTLARSPVRARRE